MAFIVKKLFTGKHFTYKRQQGCLVVKYFHYHQNLCTKLLFLKPPQKYSAIKCKFTLREQPISSDKAFTILVIILLA